MTDIDRTKSVEVTLRVPKDKPDLDIRSLLSALLRGCILNDGHTVLTFEFSNRSYTFSVWAGTNAAECADFCTLRHTQTLETKQ